MTWRRILYLLALLRALACRNRVTYLNARVRVILPAPFDWRNPHMNRFLARAGAIVASVTFSPTHADGSPGKLDGPITWTSGDQYTIEPSPGNPLAFNVIATGATGAVELTASADGDLGQGVQTISQTFHFEFVAEGEPLTVNLNGAVAVLLPAPDAALAAGVA